MEQTTNSPFVANVFDFCGTSQILEHSGRGNLYDRVTVSRRAEKDSMKPIDKLKILIHIAAAVADLHESGTAHGDLAVEQFLFMDGIYKLNDFHNSHF